MHRFITSVIGPSLAVCLLCSGCIKSPPATNAAPFAERDLDACLAIVIDMSGSFSTSFEERGYTLFLEIVDRFFQGAAGTETRLVISQLSGSDQVLVFEGRPADLRKRFRSPQELTEFLKSVSDAHSSRVYAATSRTLDYMGTLSGVGPDTRLLTVVLSDMLDSEARPERRVQAEEQLKASLKSYQSRGGALALYYVAELEMERWDSWLQEAGFTTGHYIIESDLTSSPQLPQFE